MYASAIRQSPAVADTPRSHDQPLRTISAPTNTAPPPEEVYRLLPFIAQGKSRMEGADPSCLFEVETIEQPKGFEIKLLEGSKASGAAFISRDGSIHNTFGNQQIIRAVCAILGEASVAAKQAGLARLADAAASLKDERERLAAQLKLEREHPIAVRKMKLEAAVKLREELYAAEQRDPLVQELILAIKDGRISPAIEIYSQYPRTLRLTKRGFATEVEGRENIGEDGTWTKRIMVFTPLIGQIIAFNCLISGASIFSRLGQLEKIQLEIPDEGVLTWKDVQEKLLDAARQLKAASSSRDD